MTTRRSFLQSVLGGAAVMAHSARSNGDTYWEMVRRQFPFGLVYKCKRYRKLPQQTLYHSQSGCIETIH